MVILFACLHTGTMKIN